MRFSLRHRYQSLLLLTLSLFALTFVNCGAAEVSRPNVVMIAIDDLNDWVGFLHGHPQARTPNMDRLAKRGVAFTNAHCQAPLCNPSRTSLLLGVRPHTTGIYGLAPWFRTLPGWKNHVTLPQHLAANGYRTLSAGKIFHDAYPPKEGRLPNTEFNVWGYHGTAGPRPGKKFVQTPDPTPLMDWGVFPERDELQEDWKIADWACAKLREPAPTPFFLSVGFRRPHVPCYASAKWFDLFPEASVSLPPIRDDDRDDVPFFAWYLHWTLPEPRLSWLRKTNQWKPLVRSYLASTAFVDAMVGRVLDAIRDNGLEENTLVILWSDHGWHLGEKGVTGKNTLWERSTRVPLVFAGPGVAKQGVCNRPAELLDLLPTLIDTCKLPPREGLEGHSLAPLLVDPNAARTWPAITTHNANNHSVRSERWRYIRYADGSEELYDHQTDPNEWTNLAAGEKSARPTNITSVIEEHRRWLPPISAPPAPGSAHRILTYSNGVATWEGKVIKPEELER